MSAAALLFDLKARGIELQARGDKLRFRPAAALTPELLERVEAHKGELLAALGGAPPDLPPRPPARPGCLCELVLKGGAWHWRHRRPDRADAAYRLYLSGARGIAVNQYPCNQLTTSPVRDTLRAWES